VVLCRSLIGQRFRRTRGSWRTWEFGRRPRGCCLEMAVHHRRGHNYDHSSLGHSIPAELSNYDQLAFSRIASLCLLSYITRHSWYIRRPRYDHSNSAFVLVVTWSANSFPRPSVKRSSVVALLSTVANTASISVPTCTRTERLHDVFQEGVQPLRLAC
jgi:hypothetical protein